MLPVMLPIWDSLKSNPCVALAVLTNCTAAGVGLELGLSGRAYAFGIHTLFGLHTFGLICLSSPSMSR